MAKTSKKDEVRPIIVKKVKKVEAGHHGGAWKVAYADFVTAMMAFFLLLWLLNITTSSALQVISSYFDPSNPRIAESRSGAGGLMGGLSVSKEGAQITNVQPLIQPRPTGVTAQGQSPKTESTSQSMPPQEVKKLADQLKQQEQKRFKKAKEQLEETVKSNPDLASLAKNLMIDITPEGLRIQIVDQDGKPMFPLGGSEMYDYTKTLVKAVAKVVNDMPNDISIRGHTDAHKYATGAHYTNWELSADRANSCRRELLDDGVPAERLQNIMGKADRDPMIVSDPADARNRRISIVLLNETLDHAMERGAFGTQPEQQPDDQAPADDEAPADNNSGQPVGTFQKTPGKVYFP